MRRRTELIAAAAATALGLAFMPMTVLDSDQPANGHANKVLLGDFSNLVPQEVTEAAPCVDGITPLDPYANICSIPYRPPRVLGSAPDQTALLNCSVGGQVLRAQCLSQFVNGGSGGFGGSPGAVLGPGFRP